MGASLRDQASRGLITNAEVEVAAEAAWAGYLGLLERDEFDTDEEWEDKQRRRKEWPEDTSLYPDADNFRQAVRDGLRAIGFHVESAPETEQPE